MISGMARSSDAKRQCRLDHAMILKHSLVLKETQAGKLTASGSIRLYGTGFVTTVFK